jgi:hypothetical protein
MVRGMNGGGGRAGEREGGKREVGRIDTMSNAIKHLNFTFPLSFSV